MQTSEPALRVRTAFASGSSVVPFSSGTLARLCDVGNAQRRSVRRENTLGSGTIISITSFHRATDDIPSLGIQQAKEVPLDLQVLNDGFYDKVRLLDGLDPGHRSEIFVDFIGAVLLTGRSWSRCLP